MISYLTQPTLYIPHGGGPCFFMEEGMGPPGTWDKMGAHLRGLSRHFPQTPAAILVISAHWEEDVPTVMTAPAPPLIYDYYGFPEHTYRLKYPAPGSPACAEKAADLLRQAGFTPGIDHLRGYDHGTFIPFLLIYPDAAIPIFQISLQRDLNPETHWRMGQALAPLRQQGVLIVGSGMSYHNLRAFFSPNAKANTDAYAFDRWLTETVTLPDPAERTRRLNQWYDAPSARTAHPRAEHLLPLMVAAGAAGDETGTCIYQDVVLGKAVSSYLFGSPISR